MITTSDNASQNEWLNGLIELFIWAIMTICPHLKIPFIWQIFGYNGLFLDHESWWVIWLINILLSSLISELPWTMVPETEPCTIAFRDQRAVDAGKNLRNLEIEKLSHHDILSNCHIIWCSIKRLFLWRASLFSSMLERSRKRSDTYVPISAPASGITSEQTQTSHESRVPVPNFK